MSLKWTGNQSESGILRKKHDPKEKKEELFVFGYSCKLFRDDEKAQHIDQGKHLIPWMGDETLKIDRYDARGALHSLAPHEAPPGGFDWRVELTKNEQDVEQLCDEERYRALHTDEIEEAMYREEELKRLHAAGYGQVGFTYDSTAETTPATPTTVEVDEPFVMSEYLKGLLPSDIVLPETEKLNAIIDKTAKFIATQGAQMEILLRAKQADNPQFKFLNKDSVLHPYYMKLISLVKEGKWPEKAKVVEEPLEDKPHEHEDYLHPSLGSTIIEAAPSIPTLQYRPSGECDYQLLVCRMRGSSPDAEPAPGDVPPPGTAPLPPRTIQHEPPPLPTLANYPVHYSHPPQLISARPPPPPAAAAVAPPPLATHSTGLSLMRNYASDTESESDSDASSSDSKEPPIKTPPADVQVVIDKMASYVARNGDDFAEIVRAKNDPRFTFLEPGHEYHAYYLKLMRGKRGISNGDDKKSKSKAPVSFSIKKAKEPDPVLPKPALPYESSTDEEGERSEDKSETERQEPNPKENNMQPPVTTQHNIQQQMLALQEKALKLQQSINTNEQLNKLQVTNQQAIVAVPKQPIIIDEKVIQNKAVVTAMAAPVLYKCEAQPKLVQNVTATLVQKAEIPVPMRSKIVEEAKIVENSQIIERNVKDRSKTPDRRKELEKDRESYRKEKKRKGSRKERRDKSPRRKQKKSRREESENVVISIEEDDEMIDLTGDVLEVKECESGPERSKQLERRRRAAEFLKKVGVDNTSLPSTSLGSAMVDTLKKKAEEEEKKRRRDKKRHRHDYDSSHKKSKRRRRDEDSDHDRRKRRKREKKRGGSRRSSSPGEPELALDLPRTLRGLRQVSPTHIALPDDVPPPADNSSNEEDNHSSKSKSRHKKRKEKEDREYSEGEWSSDSEEDSDTSGGDSE